MNHSQRRWQARRDAGIPDTPLRHSAPLAMFDVDGTTYCYGCGNRLVRVTVTAQVTPYLWAGNWVVQRTYVKLRHPDPPFLPSWNGC